MASLVSQAEKNSYAGVFKGLHDTFSRPLVIFKTPKRTIMSTDMSYNFIYEEQDTIEEQFVPVSGVFQARIRWNDPSKLDDWQDIRERIRGNTCRVKVGPEVIPFISGAERIELDGKVVRLIGSTQPHGLFAVDYYNLTFQETE
jgi:hypothetical protein